MINLKARELWPIVTVISIQEPEKREKSRAKEQ